MQSFGVVNESADSGVRGHYEPKRTPQIRPDTEVVCYGKSLQKALEQKEQLEARITYDVSLHGNEKSSENVKNKLKRIILNFFTYPIN